MAILKRIDTVEFRELTDTDRAALAQQYLDGHSFNFKLRVRGLRVRELSRSVTWVLRPEDGEWYVSNSEIIRSESEPELLGLWSHTMTNL